MTSKQVSFGIRGCKVSATVTGTVVTQTADQWRATRPIGDKWGPYPCLSDDDLRAAIRHGALRTIIARETA